MVVERKGVCWSLHCRRLRLRDHKQGLMRSEIKQHLSSSGLVSEADIKKAEDHSAKESISFQEALIALNLLQESA